MELATEAKMHASNAQSDLKMIWRRVVRARPPKWAVAMLCAGSLYAGWMGGWSRGYVDGLSTSNDYHAIIQMRNLHEQQTGNTIATATFTARQVDWLVKETVEKTLPQPLGTSLWLRLSPVWWADRGREESLNRRAREAAELRLKLPPPTAETLAAAKAINREWVVEHETRELKATASLYSTLLGREVPASALLTDAGLRLALNGIVVNQSPTGTPNLK